ncbi:AI-2E family transporter [Aliidiomarina maris]|uniref:AI-2E family transporter n=1 Tax=Aliidiomarina maris TaxID=531312 RepID=A0A327WUL2_9GAMM|nr:AI-2E family transporter [Aliidiomarina maris]RAJ94888.1 putative PurR-regulated permease PerM [Aliidiomarina maris]RUO20511.1 AI-2E family transporter [Aliidiomarina maris]
MAKSVENKFFLLILGVVTAGFLLILAPFWGAIFWAIALTVLFYPMYHWINQKLGDKPNISSILTIIVAILLVVIPLAILTWHIVNYATDIYQAYDDGDLSAKVLRDEIEDRFPQLPQYLERFDISFDDLGDRLSGAISSSSQYIAQEAMNIGASTMHFMISMVLMLYLSFFFFRDGHRTADIVVKAIPLGENRENELSKRFVKVTRATMKSTFIVAAVEGTLGGIILAILGVPGAVMWGFAMGILSLIPVVGAFLIWGPIAIYLFAVGDVWQAVVLVAFGSIVIGLIDNFLRPILVGRDVRLPDWLILLSILGGLAIFGVHGFVIGPILTALFVTLWDIFRQDFETESS